MRLNKRSMRKLWTPCRIADKSEFGWRTVNEYVADELVDNSEDEKRLYRSEQRAQRKVRKNRSTNNRSSVSAPSASSSQQNYSSW